MKAVAANSLSVEVGGKKLLDNLDLSIEPGTVWLISGGCATGKSTLAKVLVGLIPELYRGYIVRGSVKVYGYNPADALHRGMTLYVPQDVSLATLTSSAVEELSIYGLKERVRELREIAGDLATKEFKTLSAGERFRVLVNLSVMLGKKLIVIDEPSGYLDPNSLNEVLDVLISYAEKSGSTVLVVDHRRSCYAGKVSGVTNLGTKTACQCLKLDMTGRNSLLLEVRDLDFSYSSKALLSGLDFSVERGDVVAVTGPNGAGKTTLLKLVLGLLKPGRGVIKRYYRHVLYLPQLSSYWIGHELGSLMRSHNCRADVVRLAGIDYYDPSHLSLGEARRLAFYTGIYGVSELVVVDEVSLGLDDASLTCLKNLLKEVRKAGKAVLFSTHNSKVAKLLEPDIVVELP